LIVALEASGRSHALGFGQIEASMHIYGDPVVAARLIGAYQAIEDIIEHTLRVTRARVAEAAAPWAGRGRLHRAPALSDAPLGGSACRNEA
jgi:hypothetical protein